MSILGVTLVLFVLGIIGWLFINATKLGDYFKENVEVRTFLLPNLNKNDSAALKKFIEARPYVKSSKYVSKDEAKKKYLEDGNEDWVGVLDANPLPDAYYFTVKRAYVNKDSMQVIKKELESQTYVSDVQYPSEVVDTMNKNFRLIGGALLALAIIISLVVIFLIDNTIRLAMFSNRFLIKTMQMVGATRWFIAKPLNIKAIINGAISGVIASALLYIIIVSLEGSIESLKAIHDTQLLVILFFVLILLGIAITVFSTNRSVHKYLKMKLDDLY